MKKITERAKNYLWGMFSLLLFFAVWYAGAQMPEFARLLPDPVKVALFVCRGFIRPIGSLMMWQHILWSLSRVMAGYLMAVVAGITLGFLGSWFKTGEAIIKPFYLLLRSIPSLAWIPQIGRASCRERVCSLV